MRVAALLAAALRSPHASTVSAQTIVAEGPVVYGHHHFNTTDMAAQKRFYVETLGGTLATIGTNNLEVIEFPNVFLFFRPMQAPTGGTIGSTVNHVGFSVPDLKPVVARLKANGFKMITSDSVAATVKVTDDIAAASPTTNIAFALGPEDVKVELVEVKAQTGADPVAPRPLLRRATDRDASLVRQDVRRRRAAGQSELRRSSRISCRA